MPDTGFLPKDFIDDNQPVLSPMTELAVNLELRFVKCLSNATYSFLNSINFETDGFQLNV